MVTKVPLALVRCLSMARPPLKVVAELAGVSEPTVSRVLNGRTGVAMATRDRVTAALAELGYDHDLRQSDPTRPKSRGTIGIISGELVNPVFPELAHRIMERLAAHGLIATIGVADPNLAEEQRYVEEFMSTGVDGMVIIAGQHSEVDGDLATYQELVANDVPFVLVNGADTSLDVPHVWADESIAAERAVAHLVSLGHTRIGCILGTHKYVPTSRFISGYERAMATAGLDIPASSVATTSFTFEGGLACGRTLVERGFTGLICGNDLMALGAVAAVRRLHLDVPANVSVVGYDATMTSSISDPPLTTVRQPYEAMGQMIVNALISEIDRGRHLRQLIVFDPVLVVRSSTGPAPT